MIEEYFKICAKWGVSIEYIHEERSHGYCGCISIIGRKGPKKPIIVMNADLLTKVNFISICSDFTMKHKAHATMCVREHNIQIPYGVARIANRLIGIDEKPSQHFFVNAGIYVLEPEILDMIPGSPQLDMPNLFDSLIRNNLEVIVFPMESTGLILDTQTILRRQIGTMRTISI